jgi:pimeloyl-ACP methyl ester carboxylesterase
MDDLPAPIVASARDLPPAVAAALSSAPAGAPTLSSPPAVAAALSSAPAATRAIVASAGIPFAVTSWGSPADPPLLLVHGVTSSSATWWRVGPALAAAGRRVVAPDLPGHGRTGHWTGRHRFRETAADLAALVRALGIDGPALEVVGHSWGAMVVAALPWAGIRPRALVLLDPPVLPLASMSALVEDPAERGFDDIDEAVRVIGAANPTWTYGDVVAKACSLVEFEERAARDVLLANGDWDGGLADLADPAAAGIEVWLVRGDPAAGSYIPEAAVPAFAARLGHDHVLSIAGGPHSPQRTHPEATIVALLTALGVRSA